MADKVFDRSWVNLHSSVLRAVYLLYGLVPPLLIGFVKDSSILPHDKFTLRVKVAVGMQILERASGEQQAGNIRHGFQTFPRCKIPMFNGAIPGAGEEGLSIWV